MKICLICMVEIAWNCYYKSIRNYISDEKSDECYIPYSCEHDNLHLKQLRSLACLINQMCLFSPSKIKFKKTTLLSELDVAALYCHLRQDYQLNLIFIIIITFLDRFVKDNIIIRLLGKLGSWSFLSFEGQIQFLMHIIRVFSKCFANLAIWQTSVCNGQKTAKQVHR